MAAHRDDLHRPLLEDQPPPIPRSFSDSVVNPSPNTELADMASQTTRRDPKADMDATEEYDVITEADVETRRPRRSTDVQRRNKAPDRVTWAGEWRSNRMA